MKHARPASALTLVAIADEGYAMQLAVAIRSVIDHLSLAARCRLFIIDAGLSRQSRSRCRSAWHDDRLTVHWINASPDLVASLPVSGHVSQASYLRLLLDDLLPATVSKVIYLDVDLVVRQDLLRLWNEPLADHAVLAVTDLGSPCFDAVSGLPTYWRCRDHLVTDRPVPNYRDLGLDPAGKYFNAGVMVIDRDRWRREQVGPRAIEVLNAYREHVIWWDQYALNVILAGRWGELDHRWNQVAHVHAYPSWRESPLGSDEFCRLRDDPWVVHYSSASKPWQNDCGHPWANAFLEVLATTPWRGWRRTAPGPVHRHVPRRPSLWRRLTKKARHLLDRPPGRR